jgi:hypothetical protein
MKYVKVPKSEVTSALMEKCLNTNLATCRTSKAGIFSTTYVILKFKDDCLPPEAVINYTVFDELTIWTELAQTGWQQGTA